MRAGIHLAGPAFGPELTGAEVRYLMTREWARFPDDILWRRSKLGITMPAHDREALAAFHGDGCLSPRLRVACEAACRVLLRHG